jgi:hypothetical protein
VISRREIVKTPDVQSNQTINEGEWPRVSFQNCGHGSSKGGNYEGINGSDK